MDISITLKRFESFHVACNNNAFCTFAFYLRHAEHFCYLNSVVVSKPLPLYSSSFYNQFMSDVLAAERCFDEAFACHRPSLLLEILKEPLT